MAFVEEIVPEDFPDFYEHGVAKCAQSDPESFFSAELPFGNRQTKSVYLYEREAKALCSSCPYKMRCLEYALSNPGEQGIWGGTTERDRQAFRRNGLVTLSAPTIRYR
jgi:WhiB family redox-sensing transcriptional regulator